MMRFLPQRGPMLGEAACCFDESYKWYVKGILRLDAAGFDVSEELGAIAEDIAWIASGATVLADRYAQYQVAAERRAG